MSEKLEVIDGIVIVKVGTSTMFRKVNGQERLNRSAMHQIGSQVLRLRKAGNHVAIVTSGAVTSGMEAMGVKNRPTGNESMSLIQHLASVGLRHILNAWFEAMDHQVENGGLLVTRRELDLDAPEHDEALRTIHTHLIHGVIPIVNENDGITHRELARESFGQNDTLSAIFAAQIAQSELFGNNIRLVVLSDIDGVYADPDDPSTLLKVIDDLEGYSGIALDTSNLNAKGGMKTKFEAADICRGAGVEMWIANGSVDNAIERAINGEIGTYFPVS
jgi:glutamate 5-kinase